MQQVTMYYALNFVGLSFTRNFSSVNVKILRGIADLDHNCSS